MSETREIPNEVLLAEVSSLVAEGHPVVLKTKGYSMMPFIHGWKDSVELRLPEGGYEEGDIALAEIAKGRYVLHRIRSIEGDKVTLKGDGNLRGEEHCRPEDIKAKAYYILRPAGKGEKRIECTSEKSKQRAAKWNEIPAWARRYIQAIYRRIIGI